MKRVLIVLIQAFLFISLAGCASVSVAGAFPGPRPLGRDVTSARTLRPDTSDVGELSRIEEPAGALTAREALVLALLGNPALAVFSWEMRAREAAVIKDSRFPNPELDVEIENVGGVGQGSAFGAAETTLLLSQLFETGGKRGRRARFSALEAELAGWDYEAKRLDVLTETTVAFVEVLAAQERVILAGLTFDLSNELYSVVSARIEAGKAPPLEAARASVERSLNHIRMQKEQRSLEAARKRLSSFWGVTSPRFSRAAGKLEVTDALPSAAHLDSLFERSPEVARWETEIEHRHAALSLAKSNRFPDLTLGAGIRWFEETDDRMFVFGLSVPVPLFDRNQGGVREAEYLLAKAKEEQRSVVVAVRVQLAQAYGALQSVHSEALALEDVVLPVAEQALEAARGGYRRGKFGLRDVLDAQKTYAEVRYRYIEAFVEYQRALAAVERLIGRGLDTLDGAGLNP
jgi:cobalt-zinc-cadmium efflux system outer membrane protein